MTVARVNIIGGGLAGCEAAWQLLRRGHGVRLFEMKPHRFSPAHKLSHLAELVCSNSLKSNDPTSAPGLLKEELRALDSLILAAADKTAVPAGSALAVDRELFAREVESALARQNGLIIERREISEVPLDGLTIIATGPLTSDALARSLSELLGQSSLYFYDAIAPIVEAGSVDMRSAYWASRYDKGTADYLNCPLSEEEYQNFRHELLCGQKVAARPFEETRYFEGCLPVEVLAERGENTLAFGPMKPVGLVNPHTGQLPYAVVQLRKENLSGTLLNLVGFQTKLTWPEQRRIFRMIPALKNAVFARMGSIHRNTYINAPELLLPSLRLKAHPEVLLAGQITGVEGYLESTAMGLWAGLAAAAALDGQPIAPPPSTTAIGALLQHLTSPPLGARFEPMNINFGILDPLSSTKIRKRDKHRLYADRAMTRLREWTTQTPVLFG